jgi:hypothetical protein
MGLTKGMEVKQGRSQLDSLMIRNLAKGNSPMARLARRISQGKVSVSGAVLGEGGSDSLGGAGTDVPPALAALIFNLMKNMPGGFASPDEAKQGILAARGAAHGRMGTSAGTDAADNSKARDVNKQMLDQEFKLFMDAQGHLARRHQGPREGHHGRPPAGCVSPPAPQSPRAEPRRPVQR